MKEANSGKVILDASAIIALIGKEPGAEVIEPLMAKAVMSSVNVAEVARYFFERKGIPLHTIKMIMGQLLEEIIPFNEEQAYSSAELTTYTKLYGLSLADRACLALGLITNYPIYTADKMWEKLSINGIILHMIR